jgi:hypothetical protein
MTCRYISKIRILTITLCDGLRLLNRRTRAVLEKAPVPPTFWSRRGERVAFQIKGMHAYLVSKGKDTSALNATIEQLTQGRTFIFKSIEQWQGLTQTYDTGAISHDAFQQLLADSEEQYTSLLKKVPPAAIPGAAAAAAAAPPLFGKYGGSQCEVCETPFEGNQDRKREQKQFYFFTVVLASCDDRTGQLERRRSRNKAQTVGDCTYGLKGLANALKRPAEPADIEATIQCLNGPMSWAAFTGREVQTQCGTCCPNCWYRFCVEK